MSPSNSYCPSLVWTLISSFFLPHLSFPSWYTPSVITGSLDLAVHTFTLTSGIPATWITLSWTGKSLCNSQGIFDTLNVNYKPVSWHANGKFNLESKNLHSVVVKSSSSKVSRCELKLQFWNLTLVSYMSKQVIPRASNSSLQNEVLFSRYCSDAKTSVRSCTEGPWDVLRNRVRVAEGLAPTQSQHRHCSSTWPPWSNWQNHGAQTCQIRGRLPPTKHFKALSCIPSQFEKHILEPDKLSKFPASCADPPNWPPGYTLRHFTGIKIYVIYATEGSTERISPNGAVFEKYRLKPPKWVAQCFSSWHIELFLSSIHSLNEWVLKQFPYPWFL